MRQIKPRILTKKELINTLKWMGITPDEGRTQKQLFVQLMDTIKKPPPPPPPHS